jgi:ribosomal protein S18 acetylase RimI-like enzyme
LYKFYPMNSTIHLTQADLHNPQHQKDLLELLSSYASDIMGGGNDLPAEVKQKLIPGLQKTSSALIVLAYDGKTAVGLSICFFGFSTFYAKPLLNIHDFVVTEAYRGKGIAKLMLGRLEEIAKIKDCCKLTLEVLEGNLRAQKIYKDFGFESYQLDSSMGKALFLAKKLS